jgi:hypothetical protein
MTGPLPAETPVPDIRQAHEVLKVRLAQDRHEAGAVSWRRLKDAWAVAVTKWEWSELLVAPGSGTKKTGPDSIRTSPRSKLNLRALSGPS